MNKKSIAGLFLFGCLVMSLLIYGAVMMTGGWDGADAHQSSIAEEKGTEIAANPNTSRSLEDSTAWVGAGQGADLPADVQPEGGNAGPEGGNAGPEGENAGPKDESAGPEDENTRQENQDTRQDPQSMAEAGSEQAVETTDTALASAIEKGAVLEKEVCKLIVDSTQVDYRSYLPEVMESDRVLEEALQIENPKLSIKAQAAILFDADTMEVLFYKNPCEAVFPASTAKLLTCLVVLDWCSPEEKVRISNEIRMIARDSTTAGLYPGQVVTIRHLLEGMLLPSGNDAAYAAATYVGRKSMKKEGARREDAVAEFVRLMNDKAKQLGVLNSSFKTPDGYDAIGQYTTAYDMGLIGVAAMKNEIIIEISKKGSSHNRFITGDQVTWRNTNALVRKDSGSYYSPCIGLKTGTSTMAGKCLIAAGKLNGKEVLGVVMNSTQTGRWSDAKTLLDYGLH